MRTNAPVATAKADSRDSPTVPSVRARVGIPAHWPAQETLPTLEALRVAALPPKKLRWWDSSEFDHLRGVEICLELESLVSRP